MTLPAPARLALKTRRSLIIGVAAVLLLTAWAAVFSYLRSRAERDVRDAVAETDRLDPNWTLDEIEAKRLKLPDVQNSALRVREVKKLLPQKWPPEPTADTTAHRDVPPMAARSTLDNRVTGLSPSWPSTTKRLRNSNAVSGGAGGPGLGTDASRLPQGAAVSGRRIGSDDVSVPGARAVAARAAVGRRRRRNRDIDGAVGSATRC